MIQVTAHTKILLAVELVDFRKGIDGLAAVCRTLLKTVPMSGTWFIFRSRRGHAIKCLVYDGQGFWICQKRLSAGKFSGWPQTPEACLNWDPLQLQCLIWNGDPASAGEFWRPLSVA